MPGPEGTSDDTLARTQALSDAGDHSGALALADLTLLADPSRADAHIARGWALENLGPGRLAEAREAYAEAIALDPGALWAMEGLANVLRRLGHRAEADALAADVVTRALARTDRGPEVLELQGWCEFQLGRLEDAEATFRRALDLDADLVSVRLDLALVLLCAGRAQGSLQAYDAGLTAAARLGAGAGVVAVALDDLDQARAERPYLRADPATDIARERLRRFGDRASSLGDGLPMGGS